MKYRKIVNWVMLCAGCALIIINRLVDAPTLGWIGDVLLIIGMIMLPQTVAIEKKIAKETGTQSRSVTEQLSKDREDSLGEP